MPTLLKTRKGDYSTSERRADMAKRLAAIYNPTKFDAGFEPYKPNEDDDSYWTIDINNNMKVRFFDAPGRQNEFELNHRYARGQAHHRRELAFAVWLYEKINAVLADEEIPMDWWLQQGD